MTAVKRIGIAVVEHARRYLVGIRGPGIPLAGFAEFPGGKCRADESPSDCAVRECLEEAGLQVVAERLLEQSEFEYPHGRVNLHFVLCRPADPREVRVKHGGFHWVSLERLNEMEFPEANATVLKLLQDVGHR